MRGYKKHPFLTALVVFAVALAGVYAFYLDDDNLTKEQIFALVENQTAALEEIARSDAPEQWKRPAGVKKITPVGDTVDFSCGGTGRGEDTVYYGFYYSPSRAPDTVFRGTQLGSAVQLQPEGKGFSVQTGSTYYYTEEIIEGFYYYEAHL